MSDETLFLIAHKVRGLPAFDVAIQMIVDPNEDPFWIIPTSGHRAYPWWQCRIDELDFLNGCHPDLILADCPDPWPDHYWQPGQTSDLVIPDNAGAGLLSALGINRPITAPLERRKL